VAFGMLAHAFLIQVHPDAEMSPDQTKMGEVGDVIGRQRSIRGARYRNATFRTVARRSVAGAQRGRGNAQRQE